MPPNTLVPRAAAWAALACGGALMAFTGAAQAEDTPLSLTLSQNLRRDSNLLRSTNAQSDTVSTTAVQGNFNKAYGRQVYKASARFGRIRYDRFGSQLDNDAKDLNASVSSEFASNWLASLNASDATSLNAPQDNPINNRLLRNIRHYKDVGATLQYGNGGTWALVGSYDHNRLNYSGDFFQFQNADQNSQGLRLVYNATDLLNFGVGPRYVRTRYPNNSAVSEAKDTNLDFTVNWQVSGLSNLNALMSWRDSKQTSVSNRKGNAVTGSLGWNYTPRGIVSYGVNLTRATNADRFQNVTQYAGFAQPGIQNVALDTITTTMNMSASAQWTGKLSSGVSLGLTRYELNNTRDRTSLANVIFLPDGGSTNSSSRLRSLSFSTNYAAYRWLGLNCALQFYNQSADLNRPKYSGHVIDCGANFTLDP